MFTHHPASGAVLENAQRLAASVTRVPAGVRFAVAALAPVVPLALQHSVGLDQPALADVLAVLAATALSTPGGVAAAVLASALFLEGGHAEGLGDASLLLVTCLAVPALVWALRRTSERARSSEHRFRMLLERLPVGLYIDRPDASATNLYSSREIERMLGHPAERWQGEPGFFASILHPEDRDRVLGKLETTLADGGDFEDTFRLRAADGTYRWIVDRGVLVHDEQGGPLHVQGVLLDVTPIKEAEEQAQEIWRRYRTLVEQLPLVTYVEDARDVGRTLYVSPQIVDLLGYPVDRWLSDKDFFLTVLDPEYRDVVQANRAAGETDTTNEFRLIAADGTSRWVHSQRRLVRDDAGRALYVQGFWVDMTKQRELEDSLRRQDRLDAVGQFAAGVAHNFNNMLLAIRGYAELASSRASLDAAQPDLEVIRATADRSAELVRQLLAFSRRQPVAPQRADLRVVLGELVQLLQQLVGASIAVRFEPPPHPVMAFVDRAQLEQVIVNLAVNARDAMTDGGTLTIDLRELPGRDEVLVSVTDTGTGMPTEVAQRIFDPFFTTKSKGTGLGLATAHGSIRQIGGDIRVLTAPGRGTTFEVVLPAAA